MLRVEKNKKVKSKLYKREPTFLQDSPRSTAKFTFFSIHWYIGTRMMMLQCQPKLFMLDGLRFFKNTSLFFSIIFNILDFKNAGYTRQSPITGNGI